MTERPCAGRSYAPWGFGRWVGCSVKNAKYEEDGKFWCGRHLPSKKKAAAAKRQALYDAETERRHKRDERRAHRNGVLEKLRSTHNASDLWVEVGSLIEKDDKLTEEVKELERKLKELET